MAIADADIRDWAKATGRGGDLPQRGPVTKALREEYERLHAELDTALPDMPAGPGGPASGPPGAAGGHPGPAREEARPRPVKPGRPATGWRGKLWGGPRKPPAGRRPARPAHKRVPVDELIGGLWGWCARLTQTVNLPLARTLEWQSDSAGPLLEDAVKGTIVDAALQPLARAQGRLSKAGAILGPGVCVMGLQLPHNQPTNPDGSPNVAGALRHQVLMGALEESVYMNLRAAADMPEEAKQKQAEREAMKAAIKEVIGMIFAPPGADDEAAAAEAAAIKRARSKLDG